MRPWSSAISATALKLRVREDGFMKMGKVCHSSGESPAASAMAATWGARAAEGQSGC